MCGRYCIDDDYTGIRQIAAAATNRSRENIKTGEIRPSDLAPVIRGRHGMMAVEVVKWGYWHPEYKHLVFNARADTSLRYGSFKRPRCVVPSSGFYEWNHAAYGRKDKYLLKKPNAEITYMAGLIKTVKTEEGEREAFLILTTDANDSMISQNTELCLFPDDRRPIHDRMPVIIEPEECFAWLSDDNFAKQVLQRQGPSLALTPVSP